MSEKTNENLVLSLSNPNNEYGKNNMRDLILQFHESGKTPEQIYNILYTMGIEKQKAYDAVNQYIPKITTITMTVKEQLDLSNKLISLIDAINESQTADRTNYSLDAVVKICADYLKYDINSMTVSEQAHMSTRLLSELTVYNFIEPVSECIKSIEKVLLENTISVEVDNVFNRLSNSNQNSQFVTVVGKLNSLRGLTESEIRATGTSMLSEYSILIPEIKNIVEKIAIVNKSTNLNESVSVVPAVNLTLTERFNFKSRIKQLIENVNKYDSDKSRLAITTIKSVCEKYLNRIYSNSIAISESSDAANFVAEINPFNWMEPVTETINGIVTFMHTNYMSFEITESLRRLQNNNNSNFYTPAIIKLTELKTLSEAEIRESIKYTMDSLNWVPEIKALVETVNSLEGNLSTTVTATVNKVYSPITEQDGMTVFHLDNRVYGIKENEITQLDPRTMEEIFLTLISVEENFKFAEDSMTYFKGNNTIKFKLDESSTAFTFNGKNIDIKNSNDIRNFLLNNGSFKINEASELNMVAAAYDNINKFIELDFVQSISSRIHEGVKVNVIKLNENVYINRINPSMSVNELVKADSGSRAIELVKEYVNYDISPKVIDLLEGEAKENAIKEARKEELFDVINFLKEKRSELSTVDQSIDYIKEANTLVISEITAAEKELNELLR